MHEEDILAEFSDDILYVLGYYQYQVEKFSLEVNPSRVDPRIDTKYCNVKVPYSIFASEERSGASDYLLEDQLEIVLRYIYDRVLS